MSDIHAIVVPKWGLSMTEGTLAQWNVDIGDVVRSGDVVADIETEKIVNELEAHAGGILRRRIIGTGATVPVGELLGVIAAESVSEEAIDAFVRDNTADITPDEQSAPAETVSVTQPTELSTGIQDRLAVAPTSGETSVPDSILLVDRTSNPEDANATHLAEKFANLWRIDLSKIIGTGRRQRVSKLDLQKAISAAGGSIAAAQVSGTGIASVRATPLAKRLAEQNDIDLAAIAGSGRRGRVTKRDILAVVDGAATAAQPAPAPASGPTLVGAGVEVPLTNTRRVIGRRLSESKQSAPHFRVAADIRIDELLTLRGQLNHDGREQRVSVNDMLVKAVALALVEVPGVNVQFDGEILRQFEDADVSVAVALDDGLITPIVRAANEKGFGEISRTTADIVARAKSGDLRPEEIEGGTFTISNLGMYGVSAFDAIINQPQVAILAVGAAEKKRVFVGDDEVVALVLRATLSCDHRIVDGAMGAQFMQVLKQIIEQPGRLLT